MNDIKLSLRIIFERLILGNQNQPPALKELQQAISNVFEDSYVFEFLNISEPQSEGAKRSRSYSTKV